MEQNSFQLRKHIQHIGRMAQIANVFARHGFWSLVETTGIGSWLTPEQFKVAEEISRGKEESAQIDTGPRRLREALEELGPAFIKFGQMLASREDLVAPSYLVELKKLHKNVSTLPYSTVERVLKAELDSKALDGFEEISSTPLAAGSIGQVHPAVLKNGKKVVIKVQRPNITEQIRIDLSLMESIAAVLEKYVPELKAIRVKVSVEEFKRAIEGELDFVREAGNIEKITENFAEVDYAELPEVFWEYTTPRVLTISFLEGYSISDRQSLLDVGLDPESIVERGLLIFLKMVFEDGLYHGDMHVGNLLALDGNKIGLLDFGLTVRLSRSTRESLAGLLVSVVEEDYESLVLHFLELAEPRPGFDVAAFEDALANELSPYIGIKLVKVRAGKLLWQLARIAADHGAPMPRQLILFFKTLASFEGIGTKICPEFDIIRSSQEFSQNLVKQMYSVENLQRHGILIARDVAHLARQAPRQLRGLMKQTLDGDLSINIDSKDLRFASKTMDRLVSRLAVSVIVAALIIASAILVMARVGDKYHNVSMFGLVGFSFAGLLGLYIVYSVFRGGGGKL